MASVRPGYCAQQSYTGEKKEHFYLNSLSIKFFEHISIMSVFISLAQSVMKILLITLICATTSFYKTSVLTLENWATASRNNLALVNLDRFTPDEDLTKKRSARCFLPSCEILQHTPLTASCVTSLRHHTSWWNTALSHSCYVRRHFLFKIDVFTPTI